MKFKVVGIGGVGCSLLKTLPQFLAFRFSDAEVTLIDRDEFEPQNRDRQSDAISGNKAEVMAGILREQWPELWFGAASVFLTQENIVSLVREEDIVFLCVDNHATRKLASDRCQELGDVLLISGGNEYTDGNIQVFQKKAGENITPPLDNKFHPEILVPSDRNPGEAGCERLARSEPQLLITNNAVATAMLNAFYGFLEGSLDYDEVYIDILTNNTRRVKRENVG